MSMEYVRKTYNVPVKRGARVRVKGWSNQVLGTITSCSNYVHVRLDDDSHDRQYYEKKRVLRFHPYDLDYNP